MVSAKRLFHNTLSAITLYGIEERRAILFLIFEKILHLNRSAILTDVAIGELSEANLTTLNAIIEQVNAHVPIQYILEEVHFYHHTFYVNKHVLIPRQETEELVYKIINDANKIAPIRIADWCTGSGCIAISLAAALPLAEVTGLDISEEALKIATINAAQNLVSVQFLQQDILAQEMTNIPVSQAAKYDIIVSNPPYVTEVEKLQMADNVLLHEPHLALFVPDHSPLIFYIAIVKKAKNQLTRKGKIYLEINEQYGNQMIELLLSEGFTNVEICKDMNGKDRIASAVWVG